MNIKKQKAIIEAALLAAAKPLDIAQLQSLFEKDFPSKADIQKLIRLIQTDLDGHGYELVEVASGFRFQVRQELSPWISRLWQEKPVKYSRALLETLALVVYRQPITRAEIEEVRGVSVSSQIMRSLLERGWIKVVGHKEVPGRPALYASTKEFLDYFNLKSLEQLPVLAEIREFDYFNQTLDLPLPENDEPLQADTSVNPDEQENIV